MNNIEDFFRGLYNNFNDRNIELVIAQMTNDIKWANGMEGGYVHGHNAVREYWTRQFTMVSSKVIPLALAEENGWVKISVHQTVHDSDGKLLADEMVYHLFLLSGDKIREFHIGEKIKN